MKIASIPSKRFFLPIILIFTALLLVGCASRGTVAASSWPGLTVVEDTAYLAYNQYVRAVDLSSGMELWSYPSDEDSQATFFAPPAISPDGIVVVGSYDNQALALEPNEPFVSVLWPFEHATDRIIGGPVIVDDWVLVPSADNHLYALDMESGTQVWNKPFEAQHGLWSSPTVQDDRIYIASLDHHIYALELENGQEIWSTNLSSAVSDSPSLTDGLVLAGSIEGILFALDADNGKIIWQFTADDAIWGSPAVVDGVAYFADVSGSAYALEAASGNELWRVELPGSSSASPTIMDDRIFFVIETGEVTALLLESGAPVWPSSAEMAGRLLADAVLTDHGLLLPAMDSECEIFNVDPSTGATRCIIEPK